jgi:hypothetical protein
MEGLLGGGATGGVSGAPAALARADVASGTARLPVSARGITPRAAPATVRLLGAQGKTAHDRTPETPPVTPTNGPTARGRPPLAGRARPAGRGDAAVRWLPRRVRPLLRRHPRALAAPLPGRPAGLARAAGRLDRGRPGAPADRTSEVAAAGRNNPRRPAARAGGADPPGLVLRRLGGPCPERDARLRSPRQKSLLVLFPGQLHAPAPPRQIVRKGRSRCIGLSDTAVWSEHRLGMAGAA